LQSLLFRLEYKEERGKQKHERQEIERKRDLCRQGNLFHVFHLEKVEQIVTCAESLVIIKLVPSIVQIQIFLEQ
jgi:hypothetical protein